MGHWDLIPESFSQCDLVFRLQGVLLQYSPNKNSLPFEKQHLFVCPLRPCSPSVCVQVASHTVQFFPPSLDLVHTHGKSSPRIFSSSNRRFLRIARRDSSLHGKPTTACFPRPVTFSAVVIRTSRKPVHPEWLHRCEFRPWFHRANLFGFPVNFLKRVFHPLRTKARTLCTQRSQIISNSVDKVSKDPESIACKFLLCGEFVFLLSAPPRRQRLLDASPAPIAANPAISESYTTRFQVCSVMEILLCLEPAICSIKPRRMKSYGPCFPQTWERI